MTKVINPLFTNFYEAFGSTIVYQRMRDGSVMARKKVRHPDGLCSSHVRANSWKWAQAVRDFKHNNPQNLSLIKCVVNKAIQPNSPQDLHVTAITENPATPDFYDITLQWIDVVTKWNGWPMNNLAGYYINFSENLVSWQRITPACVAENSFIDSRPLGTYYYTVQAVDDQENVSPASTVCEVTVLPPAHSYSDSLFGTGYYC